MKVSDIITEAGINQHLAPELLQQQVNAIVDAIKAGKRLLTPQEKAVLDQARKQKIYHPDEIENNKFQKSLYAIVKPSLKKIEQLWTKPHDITSDVEAIMDKPVPTSSQKIKQLLADPNRQPIDYNTRRQLTLLLVAAACPKNNGTWYSGTSNCHSNKYPWILDQEKEKIQTRGREHRANMSPAEREEYRAKQRERLRNRFANMTPAEKEAHREINRKYMANRRANMTPAEREEVQAYHREWYRNRQAKKK